MLYRIADRQQHLYPVILTMYQVETDFRIDDFRRAVRIAFTRNAIDGFSPPDRYEVQTCEVVPRQTLTPANTTQVQLSYMPDNPVPVRPTLVYSMPLPRIVTVRKLYA